MKSIQRFFRRQYLWWMLRQIEREQTIQESILSAQKANNPHAEDRQLRDIVEYKHFVMNRIIALGGKPPKSKYAIITVKMKPKKLKK